MTSEELERIITIVQNPREYKIPDWFLNRQKDIKTGKYSQLVSNNRHFLLPTPEPQRRLRTALTD